MADLLEGLHPVQTVHRCCPLCGADRPSALFSAGDVVFSFPGEFHVVQCLDCRMLYTDPQVSAHQLALFYPDTYAAHRQDCRRARRPRTKDVWDRIPLRGGRRLLDVGCGNGDYLLRQQERGWTVIGVEPSSNAASAARSRELTVFEGTIPGVDTGAMPFDLVTLLGVLDHIPEPGATLRELFDRLAQDGLLIVSVPNAGSAAARVFGPCWPAWDLPRHQNHFTADTLRKMLQRAGFEDINISGRRRAARWRQGASILLRRNPRLRWRLLAGSRFLCSAASVLLSRPETRDELIAIARKPA